MGVRLVLQPAASTAPRTSSRGMARFMEPPCMGSWRQSSTLRGGLPRPAPPAKFARMLTHLDRRRERVAAAWGLANDVVLVGAGERISIPGGADQNYPFIAHSDYY